MLTTMLLPLSELVPGALGAVRLLAMDVDDTVTVEGGIMPETLERLQRLRGRGVATAMVTGRASGWCQGLVHYFACFDHAVAENGSVLIAKDGSLRSQVRGPYAGETRERLVQGTRGFAAPFGLAPPVDDPFHLFELVYERPSGCGVAGLAAMRAALAGMDAKLELAASSIHLHVRPKGTDKARALRTLATELGLADEEVLVVGDSATDGPLFKAFPLSVGVANVLDFKDELQDSLPRYVTRGREGYGFLELVEALLAALDR